MHLQRSDYRIPLSAAALAFLAACGAHDQGGDPLIDACEHMRESQANTVSAGNDAATAPSTSAFHTRHAVHLADVSGGKGGFTSFASGKAQEVVFALDKPVPFAVRFGNSVLPAESAQLSGFPCLDVKAAYTYELRSGDYLLEFGPTVESAVSLVAVDAGHGH